MAWQIDKVMAKGLKPVAAIALRRRADRLPVVLRHRRDAVVVWLDAHADLNRTTPLDTSAAWPCPDPWVWESALGAGPPSSQAVLVGVRDVDPAEQAHIQPGGSSRSL